MDSGVMPIASILSNQLTTLTSLSLFGVEGLACLPEGMIENNKSLAHLDIADLPSFTCISPHPQPQGSEYYCCASLSYLSISNCTELRYLPDGMLTPSLKKLALMRCHNREYIPDATDGGLTSLETLFVTDCYKITSIPFSQGLQSLGGLIVKGCPELSSLPGGLEYCTSIRNLDITNCPKVPSISIPSLSTSLEGMRVSNLDSLPISRGGFTSLTEFTIHGCESAQFGPEFSAFLQTLVSLQTLNIRFCMNLETILSSDKLLSSLRSLDIAFCTKLTCLPDGLAASSEPCSLARLKQMTIGPFFEELDAIPEWLQNIASLQDLTIHTCRNLKYLPSVEAMQRLTNLKEIQIIYCPLLEERCREESGPEWPTISHLPFVTIGNVTIEN